MYNNEVPELTPSTQKISLKEQFTTVTPLSKFLAMVLFVALPFIGFWFGLQYQNGSETKMAPLAVSITNNPNTANSEITKNLPEKSDVAVMDLNDENYKNLISFKTIFLRGELSCGLANQVLLLSWPNPYGDPLEYLELYKSDNSVLSWISCDDPWYVEQISSGNTVVVVEGVMVPRVNGAEFPDPYLNHPDREREIIKYRAANFFVVD